MDNLLNIDRLNKAQVEDIIYLASSLKKDFPNSTKDSPLKGKNVIFLFLESSTRTKTSFNFACSILGANVIDISPKSSSMTKGETFENTIKTISSYPADALVLRSNENNDINIAKNILDFPVINAGSGTKSHPTQALLDIKTIVDHKSNLDGLKIVIVGDLDHSRVTSSFVEAVSNFDIEELTFCGHPEMCNKYMDSDFGNYEPDMEKALKDADVVMTLRIQYERFEKDLDLDLETYKNAYQLSSEKLGFAKGDAIIMHPGPVNYIEITEAVYDCENSVIREQIANGVAIRMAVLSRFLSS